MPDPGSYVKRREKGWSIYPSALLAPQECSQKEDFRRFKTEKVKLWRKVGSEIIYLGRGGVSFPKAPWGVPSSKLPHKDSLGFS